MSNEPPTEAKQPRKRSLSTTQEDTPWSKFAQEVVFAPLNEKRRLVGKNVQIGEVKIDKCIYDSGCFSLLLPWPSDPDILLPYLAQPDCDARLVAGGGVGNGFHVFHVAFVIDLPSTLLPVIIEGKPCCKTTFFRFVVTYEAYDWIHAHNPNLLPPDNADFFDENLPYALLGQSILGRMVTLASSRGMVLMTREQFYAAPSNVFLWQMMNHLFNRARTADDWGTLKLLEETIHDDDDWRDVGLDDSSMF